MRLSKLEIYGFKSFAKRTAIVFPENITGIVGPNGCGKSNIADAVRWVLGEQSAKQLRGKQMTDVIFNGTQQRKAMGYCEVTLTFDNFDGELATEYTEVAVTRRVFRSGESEYILNGKECRLKDIVDLFRDTGLGKEGYSIVGQGRMDEILSNHSEDRRAVFEEAAGISRYRARKEEAQRRLDRSDENLHRVQDLLEELQGMLGPMAEQAEIAREYLKLSETLRELEVMLYVTRFDRLKKRTENIEENLKTAADEIGAATERLKTLNMTREEKEEGLERLQEALSQAHAELLKKKDALFSAQEARQAVASRVEASRETQERLTNERGAVETRMKMIEATADESKNGAAEGERLRKAAEEALETRKAEHAKTSQAAEKLEEELSRHKTAIIETMNRMQEVKTAHTRHTTMLSQMEMRKEELTQSLAADEKKEAALKDALDAAEKNLESEKALLARRENELAALEKQAQLQKGETEDRKNAAAAMSQETRALEMRIETLSELAAGYEGYQSAVKEALTYARDEKIPGVRDVVAKLIDVPTEYETALDMALGNAAQNIVTDTEQTANKLIEHLRKNRLGRATFLPLSAMRSRMLDGEERKLLSMKGCLGVASEQCGFSEEYRGVMEALLGRTVIAGDLDTGVAIMRAGGHAFRVVTLAGDVLHAGGSMTGGSANRNAQNLLGRDRIIRELQKELEDSSAALEAAMQTIIELETKQEDTLRQAKAARYELQQQEIAVVRDTERQSSAKAELSAHLLRIRSVKDAIGQLTEDINELQADLRRSAEQTEGGAPDEEAMAQKTNELSAALNTARRERERTQEALTDAMLSLQQAEHQCDRIRRDSTRLGAERQACLKDLDVLDMKKEQAQSIIDAAAEDKAKADQAIAGTQSAVKAAEEGVAAAEQQRTKAQKELRELQSEIESVRFGYDKAVDREHRQEMGLERARAQLSQLDQRLWDTYKLSYAGAKAACDEYLLVKREAGADEAFDEKAAAETAQEISGRIGEMGDVNVHAVKEYAALNERIIEQTVQQSDILKAKEDLLNLIAELEKEMCKVFVEQFALLQEYFAESFKRLFGGGHANLKLADENDPLACDVDVIVQPPGKKRQILSLFSSGERALTASALLFAMLKLRPSPFCILDEAEAALDEANVGSFGDYLREMAVETQFVAITHRKGTMERCDSLFGVAMEERGVSDLVSVNLKDYQ
ncbi:MAG: chromosome segregation protein SMC [Clostridiales bacterium]|nr:chromosome segregation protein SMC [Clostridiales bacterium]